MKKLVQFYNLEVFLACLYHCSASYSAVTLLDTRLEMVLYLAEHGFKQHFAALIFIRTWAEPTLSSTVKHGTAST